MFLVLLSPCLVSLFKKKVHSEGENGSAEEKTCRSLMTKEQSFLRLRTVCACWRHTVHELLGGALVMAPDVDCVTKD